MYSPAFLIGRNTNVTGQELGEHQIPPNTTLLLSPYLIHRDKKNFKTPDRFLPERWLSPSSADPKSGMHQRCDWREILKAGTESGEYLPFGAGPRMCIGTGFAMMEVAWVLVEMLSRYSLRPTGVGMPNPDALITLRHVFAACGLFFIDVKGWVERYKCAMISDNGTVESVNGIVPQTRRPPCICRRSASMHLFNFCCFPITLFSLSVTSIASRLRF